LTEIHTVIPHLLEELSAGANYLQTSVWGGLTASSLPISTVPLNGITALAMLCDRALYDNGSQPFSAHVSRGKKFTNHLGL